MIPQRPLLEYQFTSLSVSVVANVAQPLKSNGSLLDYIEAFIVSVPSTAANSVFLGDAGVSLTSGMEIIPGAPLYLSVTQTRQLFEVQIPILEMAKKIACDESMQGESIPFVCWNLQNWWVIASANTTFALITFRTPYIQ